MRYWSHAERHIVHIAPRKDWAPSIEQWLAWLHAVGRTPDTLRTRYYQITKFSLAVDKPINQVTDEDLVFYLADLHTEYRRSVRSCVKMFYAWCIKHELASANPADEVPAIPMTQPSGPVCPEAAIQDGLGAKDPDARMAVMLGAFCGLRRIEMTRINTGKDL